ncbi:MAG: DUF2273 domain-containing protein [Clostridiales bacterium]|nr:DUF2273 domain-containing protein [Clostridiales bacterium]
MELGELFGKIWDKHRGKIVGVLVALLFGIIVLSFGFLRALFLLICVLIGLFIGSHIDSKGSIKKTVQKLFGNDND